jgi:hypothetical protein
VDVRGVAEEEGAAVAEAVGDAMVDAVGGEPVDVIHGELQVADGATADVVECRLAAFLLGVPVDGSDEAEAAFLLEREDGDEVGVFEVDVDLAVGGGAGGVDVGDIEQAGVRAAGKLCAQCLADGGACAVAAGEVGAFSGFFGAVGLLEDGADAPGVLVEAEELGLALDLDAERIEAVDEQALVCVLRVDED